MKQVLARISPILAADAAIYVVQELLGPAQTSKGVTSVLLEVIGFGLVVIVGFVAARTTHQLWTAFFATLAFWFIWRPFLFMVVGLPIAVLFRSLSIDQALKATLGLGIALALFSPIALALGVFGGLFGRRTAVP